MGRGVYPRSGSVSFNTLLFILPIILIVSVSKNPEDIVAMVAAPEKVEEELEKPIEEDVEKVESAEKKEEVSEEEKQEEEK